MKILRSLVRPKAAPSVSAHPSVPEGLRVYAVGDIHGRADLLDRLAQLILDDLSRASPDRALTIFLGDYIDRGPDARGVIERLSGGSFPTEIVALKGNHEAMLTSFVNDPSGAAELWRRNGGLESLHAYGVDIRELRIGRGEAEAARSLRSRLPDVHSEFLARLQASITLGDYFFCHAGVRPGVPLDRQDDADLLWIRDEFLASDADFGKVIVHGHSPVPQPEFRANRINIDTGAYLTHRLSCLVLCGTRQGLLTT